jgi:predicted cobalt transporter CbtA
VILRDGSRYRGLIVESIPDDHISIAIAEGTLRQLPFEEVVYAGPSKTAPASPVVATRTASRDERPHTETKRRSPKPGESMVHFRTRTPELTVWVAEVSNGPNGPTDSGFRRLCEAPCSEPLEHGLYRLAYSRADSRPLEVKSNININREAAVEADISSRRGTRVAGWVILGLGAATGTVLLSLTFDPLKGRRDGYIVGGVAALALGPTLGLPLALTSDTAIVAEVGLPRSTPNTPNAGDTGTYNGLAWTGRF